MEIFPESVTQLGNTIWAEKNSMKPWKRLEQGMIISIL